jgi:EAL domain-containing protein (putative c-di-GMP-specific phosphodiesterase class I)
VDVVKVDRVFVDGLNRDEGAAALLQAIVRLGTGLRFQVIAEGIEQAAQLESLQEIGCGFGQGFFLSEPLPEQELIELLSQQVN